MLLRTKSYFLFDLQAVAAEVGLPDDYVYYFALFLMRRTNEDDKGTSKCS